MISLDDIRKTGKVSAGKAGEEMVEVTCDLDGFRDNGKRYRKGDSLHMEISMVPPAVAAGQVVVNTKPSE